jgi:hypothetical protein
VQPGDGHVEQAVRHLQAAGRLGLGREQAAHPGQRAQAGLQVGQVAADLVQVADEHRGDQEQRHQLGRPHPPVDHQGDPRDGRDGEQRVQQQPGPPRDAAGDVGGGGDPRVHLCGQLRAAPDEEGLTERGPYVVAGRDPLLHGGGVLGPGHLLFELAAGHLGGQRADHGHRPDSGEREQDPGGPPGQPCDDPDRPGAQQRADHVPADPAQQVAQLVRVVVDAVEHLADGLLGQHRKGLLQRGLQQVAAQPPLGPVHHSPPGRPRHGVQQCGADDGQGQGGDQRRGGTLGQPSCHHGAGGLAERRDPGRCQRPPGARGTEPVQADLPRGGQRPGSSAGGRGGAVEEGHVRIDATGVGTARRRSFGP